MSKATLQTRPADVGGALDASLTDSLHVVIQEGDCTHYYGTAEQLRSEGFVPDGFRWEGDPAISSGSGCYWWSSGAMQFTISRKRPPHIRMKAKEWAERNLWHVRAERLYPERPEFRELRAARKKFNVAAQAVTPKGIERRRQFIEKLCDAGRDTRLQAFLTDVIRQAHPKGGRVL